MRADPEAGLEMFTEMRPALPPEAVLPILTAEVPQLCAPYLEAALQVGCDLRACRKSVGHKSNWAASQGRC